MKKMEEIELDNIMEEIKVEKFIDDFIESTEEMTMNQNKEEKKNFVKAEKQQKPKNKMDKETKMYFAKNIALVVATGIFGYFKLISPILYIPIEIIGACAFSFKCGEIKGRMINNGRIA